MHLRNLSTFAVFTSIVAMPTSAFGFADLDLGASVMSVNATHSTGSVQTLSGKGVAGSYTWFSSMKLSIRGKFIAQFSPTEFSTMCMGGSGGFTYYPVGGKSVSLLSDQIRIKASPRYNLMLYAGVASFTYDFRTIIDAPERATTGKKETVARTGQFMGIDAMVGYEYFLSFLQQQSKLFVNASLIQSFNPPEQYTVTLLQAAAGFGISL